jgi:uroporphyrinogen decarboxylase
VNSRERVRLALTGRTPDRIPFTFGFFSQPLAGINDLDTHFGSDVRYVEFNPPKGQNGFLDYLSRLPGDIHVGNTAQLHTYHEWNYHPELGTERPLSHVTSVAELTQTVFPDLTHPRRYAGLERQVRHYHDQGLAVAGSPPHLGGQLFETAWRMRKFENFMLDLVQRKDVARYLLDQLTAMLIHNAVILARSGVDILLLDDDVAMPTGLMISPDTWREFFKPRLTEMIRLAREAAPELIVFYHSDGNFSQLIPDLIDIGINVINPVQPDCMDAEVIKAQYGHQLALWGTVGSAWLWDQGTPRAMRTEVRHCIDTFGPGGLLLCPAYDIDYTPMENIVAFVETVKKYG